MDGKPSLLIGLSPRFHGFLQEYKKFVLEIAKICDYLNERYKATLLFIPIQRTFLYSQGYQWKYDDTVAEEATRLLRKKENVFILKREKYLPEEIAGVIGLLDLYISAPLHSLMAAFIQEVPMIGLDYSAQFDTKIPEFFESIDQCDFLISSYSKVTFSLLKNKLFKSFNSLPERKRVMKREKRLILSRAKSNFYWLFSILDRSSPRGSFVNYF
jgi:polysaccharide pyruvyl transferase WcaK-like protein